jgi:uncharacterized membrane protein
MGYTYFKLIHLFAVVIFLGIIITGLFWMRIAVKTSDLKIINFTMRTIIKLDRYFTIPGVIIITTFGIIAAVYRHFPLLHTGWILWSIILFTISGLAFGFKIAPIQKRINNLTLNKEPSTEFDWKHFEQIYYKGHIWGIIALLTPMGSFIMMIFKIPK